MARKRGRKTGNMQCTYLPKYKKFRCQIVVSGKTHKCEGKAKKYGDALSLEGDCRGW